MRRSSVYYPLRYIVQCQPAGQAFFENIAAFNSDRVAIDYVIGCERYCLPDFKYRVIDHKNNKDKCIHRGNA